MVCFLWDFFKKCFEYFLNKIRNKIKFFLNFYDSKNNVSGVFGGIWIYDFMIRNYMFYLVEL